MMLLGSSLIEKGERIAATVTESSAVALSSGSGPSRNPKEWVCEDSLAVHVEGEGALAMVADAHFGGQAGEILVRGLLEAFRATSGRMEARLTETLRQLDAAVHRHRTDGSETTALLVHLEGKTLHWASIGDSLLLVCSKSRCRHINQVSTCPLPFVGRVPWDRFPLPVEPDAGRIQVSVHDLVLLASDGIETDASGLTDTEITKILAQTEGSLEERLKALQTAADQVETGGGGDNLALVALQPR